MAERPGMMGAADYDSGDAELAGDLGGSVDPGAHGRKCESVARVHVHRGFRRPAHRWFRVAVDFAAFRLLCVEGNA